MMALQWHNWRIIVYRQNKVQNRLYLCMAIFIIIGRNGSQFIYSCVSQTLNTAKLMESRLLINN